MEETTIVKEEGETVIESPKTEEVVTDPVVPPGAKTDPALLLSSLQEEREKRRIAEEKAKAAEEALKAKESADMSASVAFSEEGKLLEGRIISVEAALKAKETEDRLNNLMSVYPVLKEKKGDFESFLASPENSGMKIETAARAFLVENDLLEKPPRRKGLEDSTGGVRTPVSQDMTPEEIDELRVTNYREYSKRLKNGTLGKRI